MHLDDNNRVANFTLLTANLKMYLWNKMLNWWLLGCKCMYLVGRFLSFGTWIRCIVVNIRDFSNK